MHLLHLSLTDYRIFTRLDMDVPRRILLLVGDNAQGKTSLLEAIYYLATFTSFHAQHDRQLVNFAVVDGNLVVTRLVGQYERRGHPHCLEVRLIKENGGNGTMRLRKEILLDGVKQTPQAALGQFTAVIFLPQMTRIIEGAPEERRRYLNLALAQAIPGYPEALTEYARALAQRNALLKQLNERGGDAEQLTFWDELIASRGAFLIQSRLNAIAEIELLAARIHAQLTRSSEILRLNYLPAYNPFLQAEVQPVFRLQIPVNRIGFSLEDIRTGFLKQLRALRKEEIARGITTIGPHRDELRFLGNGIDLGDYGSRGQIRTAMLSLKLAEVAWLKEKTSDWPVLLLDEMMAELDPQRRADLLAYLQGYEQAILTTTDPHLFHEDFLKISTIWQINAGQVTAIRPD